MIENALRFVATDSIVVPDVRLRDVQDDDPDYVDLLMSIDRWGILEPLVVREVKDTLVLVEGLQRWSCACRIGLEQVPVHVIDVKDSEEALILSCVANLQHVKTPPYQFAKAIRRLIRRNPELSLEELSGMFSKSVEWVRERLSLTKLNEDIGVLVDSGDIKLKAAFGLTLLSPADQEAVVPQTKLESAADFYKRCVTLARDKLSVRHVSDQEKRAPEVRVNPALRTRAEIEREQELEQAFHMLLNNGSVADAPLKAFKLALDWVLQMDPISFRNRKAKAIQSMDEIQAKRDEVKRAVAERLASLKCAPKSKPELKERV